MKLVQARLLIIAALAAGAWSTLPIEDRQTAHQTVRWAEPENRSIEISDVNGSIRVVGEDRQDVQMTADTIIRAATVEDVSRAKQLEGLTVTQSGAAIRVCATPQYCGCDNGRQRHDGTREERYQVRVDFDLRVPKHVIVKACSVNGGTLSVNNTDGDFDMRNVNGGVELMNVGGSGRAETVNGSLSASFAASPQKPSAFKTVNGSVSVALPSDLNADLKLKTVNGGLYTDFDAAPLPSAAPIRERRNGGYVYRRNRSVSVRVGRGGPELTFDGVNGDVRVLRRK
ncbi:MAG TPA: hypothetical protein VGZ27_19950 [Vicinamibacterales bacterium]|jgi:hypothetical protein|nr:hypothetical protein [Vicinamibacterales bacterium]